MSVRMSQMGVSPPRLELPQPIAATLVDMEASIVEVSLVGCAVHHPERVKVGSTVSLQFAWQGKRVRMNGKVARSTMQFSGGKPLFVTGLQIDDSEVIRQIVESLIPASQPPAPAPVAPQPEPPKAAPARQPAPKPAVRRATTPPPIYENVPFLRMGDDEDADDKAAAPEPELLFLRCRFVDGSWHHERVSEAAQPDDGFTILAETDDIDGLCRTYEVADPETRHMMRVSFDIANEQQRRA